jgi:hypothetical protein
VQQYVQPGAVPNDGGSNVVAERTAVPDDSDGLTKATVAKMCEYIAQGAADPLVQQCAQYAAGPMARIFPHPAYGVFFFLKHRVRRVLDEGNMFRVGEPGASDMLIAPAVLLRMKDPAEDCDGFTMAAASMLQALGIPNCIVTVACDPREPGRWSHVFGMVQMPNGSWIPLDCSHGEAPGQFPRGLPQRVSRWQAWDLNGNPIDVQMPAVQTQLRGYTRRGMGQLQDCTGMPCADGSVMDSNCLCGGASTQLPVLTLPGDPALTAAASSTPTSAWTQLVAALAGDATKVASIATLPAGYSLNANCAVVPNISSVISSILPLALLALGAVVVINMVEGAGKR